MFSSPQKRQDDAGVVEPALPENVRNIHAAPIAGSPRWGLCLLGIGRNRVSPGEGGRGGEPGEVCGETDRGGGWPGTTAGWPGCKRPGQGTGRSLARVAATNHHAPPHLEVPWYSS